MGSYIQCNTDNSPKPPLILRGGTATRQLLLGSLRVERGNPVPVADYYESATRRSDWTRQLFAMIEWLSL